MRRSGQYCRIGTALLAAAAFGFGTGNGRAAAQDLNEGWVTLVEASTDGYYRDRVHSSQLTVGAIAKLPEIAKSGRPRQKAAAEALIDVLGKKTVAEAEAARSRGQLKSDEKMAQLKMLAGGLYATRDSAKDVVGPRRSAEEVARQDARETADVTNLFMGTMNSLAGSATRMAEAQGAASAARQKVHATWEKMVFPAVRNLKLAEMTSAPLEVEITSAGSSREVWSCIRNVSGKTLTNVVIALNARDSKKDLAPQAYFVREWPADVVIRPDPFRMWSIPTGMPGTQPPSGLSATYEVWCEQGHAKPADAKCVGFYDLRDPFVDTMVRPGARYAAIGGDESSLVLEFTRVAKERDGRVVEATITRPPANPGGKPEVIRYRGHWVANRNPKGPHDEVVDLKLKLAQVDPKPRATPAPAAKKQRTMTKAAPEPPGLVFKWDRPSYLVELKKGDGVQVQPLPDAK